jgi:hypothetical protein
MSSELVFTTAIEPSASGMRRISPMPVSFSGRGGQCPSLRIPPKDMGKDQIRVYNVVPAPRDIKIGPDEREIGAIKLSGL